MLTDQKYRYARARETGLDEKAAAAEAGCAAKGLAAAALKLENDKTVAQTRAKMSQLVAEGKSIPEGSLGDYLGLPKTESPLEFLTALMNCDNADLDVRRDAAKSLLPYTHRRLADMGKKERQAAEADELSTSGKYRRRSGPVGMVSG